MTPPTPPAITVARRPLSTPHPSPAEAGHSSRERRRHAWNRERAGPRPRGRRRGHPRLCDLDGVNGRLAYQGYDIESLARQASFEEVVWLLWHGELPGEADLAAFRKELIEARPSRPRSSKVLKLLPKSMHPMRVLQMGVALLGGLDPDAEDNSPEANRRKATRLVARVSSLTAAFHRIRIGRRPIAPRPDLSHAANFLYMLSGRKPRVVPVRAFDAALILYAEHELNASTFTARVVASTLSDMHSAVSAAIGALKGSLHGGAGEAVMRTLEEIGQPDNADDFTRRALAEKRRLMGFGHRVYKAGDPRAKILRTLAAKACRNSPEAVWYETAIKLHEAVNREKGLIPERRLLLGPPLQGARNPGRPVRPGHRGLPDRRLDGATSWSSTRTTASSARARTTSGPARASSGRSPPGAADAPEPRPEAGRAATWCRATPRPARRSRSGWTRFCSPTRTAPWPCSSSRPWASIV